MYFLVQKKAQQLEFNNGKMSDIWVNVEHKKEMIVGGMETLERTSIFEIHKDVFDTSDD